MLVELMSICLYPLLFIGGGALSEALGGVVIT